MQEGFFCCAELALSAPHETLRILEKTFAAGVCYGTSFNACHGLKIIAWKKYDVMA